MSTTMFADALKPLSEGSFKFSFNRDVLDGAAQVALEVNAKDALGFSQALLQNSEVPKPPTPITLGSTNLSVEGGKDVVFGSGTASVGFSAKATAKLGVFGQQGQLRDGIVDGGDLAESIEGALDFNTGSTQPFLMFRWGYDVNATASGNVALGSAGQLQFSANVGRQGLYAIIRQVPLGLGCRDAVASLVRGVRLPKQVKTVDDLEPGSWMIAETDSAVGFRADVKFGHDFSWIRQTSLGTLKGDVGLRVAAGVSAGLGFNAAGKYAVMLSRESPKSTDKKLRLRIYKLRMHEWNFAFRAEATVTPVAGILPSQFDDFLKGVLGVHANQVMRALGKFDDWTDPDKPLFGPFVALADDKAQELLRRITGIDDLRGKFDEAKGRVQQLFERWNKLPADAAARVMAAAGDVELLNRIRTLTKSFADADGEGLKSLLKDQLKDLRFLNSEEGRIIEKLAVDGLFGALTNAGLLQKFQSSAKDLLQLLDGSLLQETLVRLQREISDRLNLDQIENAVNSADLDKLDAWMRSKLEDFIEQKLVGAEGVKKLLELRDSLRKIRETMPELYKKALAALQRDYSFSISATYKKTTTTTALVDIDFDFGIENSQAVEGLRLALTGRFDDVMSNVRPGVTLREGALTHGVRRETNVVIALPFFNRETIHINEALAKMTTVAQSGGRLYYELAAQDIVTVKNSHTASLTISMQLLKAGRNADVMVHSEDSASYKQSFDRAFFNATTEELVNHAAPFVEPLFKGEFGDGDFRTWVQDAFGADARLGKSLMALDVTLPPQACLAWLKAPADKKDPTYQTLSIALQSRFKQLIHDSFFQRIERYKNVAGATSDSFAVLVFTSMPPASKARIANGRAEIAPDDFAAPGARYWDFRDNTLRRTMAGSSRTVTNLTRKLAVARKRLQSGGDPDNVIGFYKDSQIPTILGQVIDSAVLSPLFIVEEELINQACEAALAIARFAARSMDKPADARKALADFGSKVTDAFNDNLRNLSVGDALMPLGALMFIEAVKCFDRTLELDASAMFNLTDVRDDIRFPPDKFPDHDSLPANTIVRSETLVHVP